MRNKGDRVGVNTFSSCYCQRHGQPLGLFATFVAVEHLHKIDRDPARDTIKSTLPPIRIRKAVGNLDDIALIESKLARALDL